MKNTPPGADLRFNYVSFSGLWPQDQNAVSGIYMNGVAYIPDNEYMYPVKKTGRLASGRRWISQERTKELHDLHQVRQVMES
jgi:hypothetical protein